jgi:CubicO group peptidase (beta-lactamase class C family)
VGTLIAHVLLLRTGAENCPDLQTRLQDEIPALIEKHRVPGTAIPLVHGGDVVGSGLGSADRTNNAPVTAGTAFRAGSLSLPVTAWGVMRCGAGGEGRSGRTTVKALVTGPVRSPNWP